MPTLIFSYTPTRSHTFAHNTEALIVHLTKSLFGSSLASGGAPSKRHLHMYIHLLVLATTGTDTSTARMNTTSGGDGDSDASAAAEKVTQERKRVQQQLSECLACCSVQAMSAKPEASYRKLLSYIVPPPPPRNNNNSSGSSSASVPNKNRVVPPPPAPIVAYCVLCFARSLLTQHLYVVGTYHQACTPVLMGYDTRMATYGCGVCVCVYQITYCAGALFVVCMSGFLLKYSPTCPPFCYYVLSSYTIHAPVSLVA